jgi:[glutamine synthetase] adenylyltransferase / [glutamine synthetase]-adenylyl-L-tyrosine phosphorylase
MQEFAVFEPWIQSSANPERAKIGLSNWLQATGNARLYAEQIAAVPEFAKALLALLGASQAMCDLVAQNPELPTLYLEEAKPATLPSTQEIIHQGRQLLESSISFQHSLDRLRYLRQRKIFRIALVDVNDWQPPEKIWLALSDLADSILKLTLEVTWEYHCRMRLLGAIKCPLNVIAFGKHGGQEVNYSSDLDLVFVLDDGLDEKLEREVLRFAEAYIKAMTDRMGRGALYRIDMRLRPYGAAGELAKSMRATEAYYKLYAEAWEVQALIRSRPIIASAEVAERWEAGRERLCFKPHVSEFTTDSVLEMRERIDALADQNDFKRGRGGIRDIEFTVQAIQLVHGYRVPELRVPGTLPALRAMATVGLLGKGESNQFETDYQWLRQLEHRCQLLHDQQTHQLPVEETERETVAKLVREIDIVGALARRREEIARIYYRFNHSSRGAQAQFDFEGANRFLGNRVSPEILGTLLLDNEGSLRRLSIVMEQAPLFEDIYKDSWELSEALLSGEIEERFATNNTDLNLSRTWTVLFTQWLLGSLSDPTLVWANHVRQAWDSFLSLKKKPEGLEVIMLGSCGARQMFPTSDMDLVFIARDEAVQRESEEWLPHVISQWQSASSFKRNPASIDLRLRPDGSKGLLVRTQTAFETYARNDMEPWERYMMGFSDSPLIRFMDGIPWLQSHEDELMSVKRRVENERLTPESKERDVKIGIGAMMDIQWIGRLTSLRRAEQSEWHPPLWYLRFCDSESELRAAYRFFTDLRVVLQLRKLGDVLPIDERLMNGIALQMGLPNGDALWQKNLEMRYNVRKVYTDLTQNP